MNFVKLNKLFSSQNNWILIQEAKTLYFYVVLNYLYMFIIFLLLRVSFGICRLYIGNYFVFIKLVKIKSNLFDLYNLFDINKSYNFSFLFIVLKSRYWKQVLKQNLETVNTITYYRCTYVCNMTCNIIQFECLKCQPF